MRSSTSIKTPQAWGAGSATDPKSVLRQRFPTLSYLDRAARRRIPRFAYDFLDGGTGEHVGTLRNRAAFDAIEIVPRYGTPAPVSLQTELFGRRYNSPIGISPVGVDGLVWPGATQALAHAAAAAGIPYIVGTLASASIEQVAEICPGSVWFQLYGLPADDHLVTFDLVRRASAAGAHVLVATLDAPVRAKRPRDLRNGLVVPFRPSFSTIVQVLSSPWWASALLRNGTPTFPNIKRYAGTSATSAETAAFVQQHVRGTFSWEEVERLREAWPRALVLKGVQHPRDAETAISLGVDGVLVSNHGGRQSDAAPAAIDVLPAVASAIGSRATILFDSGIRSGLDAARALAFGAAGAFCGRAFLLGLAALGETGAVYVAEMLAEELRVAMAQHGATSFTALRQADIRHASGWSFPDREIRGNPELSVAAG
jgi:(S)-mandelate dehydrogenase